MVEIRAILLPAPEPLRIPRAPAAFADVSLRPLARGLVSLVALSLPVLGCTLADWFHGSASRPVQVAAVPFTPPQNGAAARMIKVAQATAMSAPSSQAALLPREPARSLGLP